MKRHQNLTPAPNEARTRPLCFAACIPVSEEKTNRCLSPLGLLLSRDDTLNFVQLQFVPPRVVRLKVPRCRSVCSAGLFTVPLPGVGSRVKECGKKQKYEDRPPSLIWTCRSVSVCPVPVDPLLSMRGRCAEEEEGEEEGGLSRVSTGRNCARLPTLAERRGQREVGTGCSWIDPSFPALMKPSSNHEISGVFPPPCFARETREALQWKCTEVQLC